MSTEAEALAAARKVIAQDRDVLVRSYSNASGAVDADAQPFLTEYDETLALIDAALASKASTAPSSETRVDTYRHRSFAERMQSLMRLGLIAGITPTSIRKRSPQQTLDIASSWPAGSDAASPKADSSSSNE